MIPGKSSIGSLVPLLCLAWFGSGCGSQPYVESKSFASHCREVELTVERLQGIENAEGVTFADALKAFEEIAADTGRIKAAIRRDGESESEQSWVAFVIAYCDFVEEHARAKRNKTQAWLDVSSEATGIDFWTNEATGAYVKASEARGFERGVYAQVHRNALEERTKAVQSYVDEVDSQSSRWTSAVRSEIRLLAFEKRFEKLRKLQKAE